MSGGVLNVNYLPNYFDTQDIEENDESSDKTKTPKTSDVKIS